MMVVLRENIANLGRIGDVIKVSDGYARNYLLPRNLVIYADEKNIAAVEHQKRILEKTRLQLKANAEEIAKQLEGFVCVISRKVGEENKLFGSVSSNDVAEKLSQAGYKVEKRSIVLENPIKTLGMHTAYIKLETGVGATVKISVVKE